MLASIMNVFTGPRVLPEGELQIASVSGVWSAFAVGFSKEGFVDKGLAENFPMFGLGRAAVAQCDALNELRSSSKLRTCKFPAIRLLHEIIEINDLK